MTPEDELINKALGLAAQHWRDRAQELRKIIVGWKRDDRRRPAFEQTIVEYEAHEMAFVSLHVRRTRDEA